MAKHLMLDLCRYSSSWNTNNISELTEEPVSEDVGSVYYIKEAEFMHSHCVVQALKACARNKNRNYEIPD